MALPSPAAVLMSNQVFRSGINYVLDMQGRNRPEQVKNVGVNEATIGGDRTGRSSANERPALTRLTLTAGVDEETREREEEEPQHAAAGEQDAAPGDDAPPPAPTTEQEASADPHPAAPRLVNDARSTRRPTTILLPTFYSFTLSLQSFAPFARYMPAPSQLQLRVSYRRRTPASGHSTL